MNPNLLNESEPLELNLLFANLADERLQQAIDDFYDEQMRNEDARAEADYERHEYRDEVERDDRFDNDNADARRDQDDFDREHEAGEWDYRNDN